MRSFLYGNTANNRRVCMLGSFGRENGSGVQGSQADSEENGSGVQGSRADSEKNGFSLQVSQAASEATRFRLFGMADQEKSDE